ncbi:GLPGLI family protein [Ornithobacterium rhinotracheale]|uniref:GLPGLI family protein n=1 Tax=Ornithobacterium rhinotracheale TaxID=28251 RepID=UPI004035B446
MKKIILNSVLLLFSMVLCAQSVVVDYEQTKHMKIGGDNPNDTHKLMMQVYSRPTYYKLFIFKDKSLYQKQEVVDNGQKKYILPVQGEVKVESVLTNYADKKQIQEAIYARKKFWVESQLQQNYQWELKDGEQEILGFLCRKAVAKTDTGIVITAWYTTDVPYKMGPLDYYGLPGLIMKVVSHPENQPENNVETIAINIGEQSSLPSIEKFNKNKIISSAEFQKLIKDHLEQLKMMRGGGVNRD